MYARIENGVVMEVIDFDPQGRFTAEIAAQFIECPSGIEPNMRYVDGEFLPPIEPEPGEPQTPPEIADLCEAVANLYEKTIALQAEIDALKGGAA